MWVLRVVGNPLHDLLDVVCVLELEWSLGPGVQGHDRHLGGGQVHQGVIDLLFDIPKVAVLGGLALGLTDELLALLCGDGALLYLGVYNALEEAELLVLVDGAVDFPAQLVLGSTAEGLSFLWGLRKEDGLGLACGCELKELTSGGMVEHRRLAVGFCPLIACNEAFKLRCVWHLGLRNGFFDGLDRGEADVLQAELLISFRQLCPCTTVLNRCVVVEDDHHAHAWDCITIVASINDVGLEVVGVTIGFAEQTAHLWPGRQDVVKLLRVNVLANTRLRDRRAAVVFLDVEVNALLDALVKGVVKATALSATQTSAVLGCVQLLDLGLAVVSAYVAY